MTRDALRDALQAVPVEKRLAVVFALTGLSQQEVAARIGMATPTFSKTVSGWRQASDKERRAIAKAIGLSVTDLFGEQVAA